MEINAPLLMKIETLPNEKKYKSKTLYKFYRGMLPVKSQQIINEWNAFYMRKHIPSYQKLQLKV